MKASLVRKRRASQTRDGAAWSAASHGPVPPAGQGGICPAPPAKPQSRGPAPNVFCLRQSASGPDRRRARTKNAWTRRRL